jgi:Gluconate 2-dehydrogenase subunit 3
MSESLRNEGTAASQVGHLPNHGGAQGPGPPPGLPRQRRGITPQMHGRYPDYDALEAIAHWDQRTREVVLARVQDVPELRFFDADEVRTLRAFCDIVTAQDSEPRIPVLELVDAKLDSGRLDGFRYADLPPDPETWRRVAASLDESARAEDHEHFAAAPSECQHELVERFSKGELDWELPVAKAWAVVMRMALAAFYSHPWAWSEIGFGGPAYPRGFARLGAGQREQWEAPPRFDVDPVADAPARGLE